jgi:hypothetical protein
MKSEQNRVARPEPNGSGCEKFKACPVLLGVRFDEGGADSLLVISIFRGTNKVGYQALLY